MMLVPASIVEHPAEMQPAGPPRLELHLCPGNPANSTAPNHRTIPDVLDLSVLGPCSRDPPAIMTTGLVAPIDADEQTRREWIIKSMVYMAQEFGFARAAEERLLE